MEIERRDSVRQFYLLSNLIKDEIVDKTKPFDIPKALVWKAFQLVKANQGAAGVDGESITEFEQNLSRNLYKLWNRMSSGSYFPPAVKGVKIPKKQPGEYRLLGVPCVSDRICQMVVKLVFEPLVEPYFLPDSYGYRANKSALDAVAITRERCWQYDYVLEFDIRALFDRIDHKLLLKAVRKHTDNKWVILYIERWLTASMQMPDGTEIARTCGTPQGGVASPVLANLFLHYVFDAWMTIYHKDKPWARYADDGIVHCRTETEAQALLVELRQRFAECGLEIHPDKTKIVYCKDSNRNENYPNTSFTFLGYEFRQRKAKNYKTGTYFMSFLPAVSKEAKKSMSTKIRELNVRNRSDLSLEQLAQWLNPILNGWINYYGKFTKSALSTVFQRLNTTLIKWSMRKYKKLREHFTKAAELMERTAIKRKHLFAHWKFGVTSAFV